MNACASRLSPGYARRFSSLTALCALATGLVGACGGEAPASPSEPPGAEVAPPAAGAVRGELVTFVLTLEEGGMQVQHYLRTGSNQGEQRLFFSEAPTVEPGALLDVWGQADGEGIKVDRWTEVRKPAAVESQSRALINGQPLKPRRLAFVLVDLGGGVKLTKEDARKRLFGTAPGDASIRQYFIEASYGRQDISGEIIGPIKGTMTGCNFPQLANSLRGSVPTGFDHYLWYFGTRVASCGFEGVAVAGRPSQPTRDTWYNASAGCVVLVQEPAHNFGAMHSSAMRCRNMQPFADDPQATCVHSEYGDRYDPMGSGCRHMNGFQKAFQGWFGGCNMIDINSSGEYTLLPLETPCNGTQVLQVPMPKNRQFVHGGGGGGTKATALSHYYLEYRAPIGLDTGLTPVVQVRVAADIRKSTQSGDNSWFLDMNPATTVQEGLIAGGTFSDPAGGLKITVVSIEAKKAVVKVEMTYGKGGAPTCMDGTPLPSPAPGPESCSASIATPDGLPPPPPPMTADGGMPSTPGGSGGSGGGAMGGSSGTGAGGSSGAGDGALVPVSYDAGSTEGFKDAAPSSGSGETFGRGGSSGSGSGKGGSGGGNTAVPSNPAPASGGFGCSVQPGGGAPTPAGAALSVTLVLIGLGLRRRRARG